MIRRRVVYSTSFVYYALKNLTASVVSSVASSLKLSFAGALALGGIRWCHICCCCGGCSIEGRGGKGCHLLLLIILARAQDRISRLFIMAHPRPYRLIIALVRLDVAGLRHIQTSGDGSSYCHCPLLHYLNHPGVRLGQGGRGSFLAAAIRYDATASVDCPRRSTSSRRPSIAVIVLSGRRIRIFSFSFSSSSFPKRVDVSYCRALLG